MWKEKLPVDCPPSSAKELDFEAYRILKSEVPNEKDFLPYVYLHPENNRYKTLCEAYAISSFDSINNAIKAWKRALKRGKKIGTHIAKVEISKSDGKNDFNPKSGHFSTWLYESKNYDTFECVNIKIIDAN